MTQYAMTDRVEKARQPRGVVKLNGERLPGWIAFEVEKTLTYEADTFRLTLAVSALPPQRQAAWLAQQAFIECEIWAGFPTVPTQLRLEELTLLIVGQVDEVNFDPVAGTVELAGRDLTARLIDTKITETWLNHTASEMVSRLAERHGLTAHVISTREKIGLLVSNDTVSFYDQSEWEVLTQLARWYQYQVSVQGRVLYFAPPAPTAQPYVLAWQQSNETSSAARFAGMTLKLTRHLTVAQEVTVIAQSFSPITKRQFTVQYPTRQATGQITPGQAKPPRKVYRYRLPQLTRAQALRFVQAKHREITQHERRLSATVPAEAALTIFRPLQLTGTATALDQFYYPESLVHDFDGEQGYRLHIQAKNRTTQDDDATDA
jgi:phage protein D